MTLSSSPSFFGSSVSARTGLERLSRLAERQRRSDVANNTRAKPVMLSVRATAEALFFPQKALILPPSLNSELIDAFREPLGNPGGASGGVSLGRSHRKDVAARVAVGSGTMHSLAAAPSLPWRQAFPTPALGTTRSSRGHQGLMQPARPATPADVRRTIVKAAPKATVAELSTAAQMARLSSLVYYPDPVSRLEALGLEIKECKQTPYTAFFVADGPADLSAPRRSWWGGGRTRYIIARGVAFDRKEVKQGELWGHLLKFWPVEFERSLTPHGTDLLVHEGVKEIAETVYQSLLPYLAFDPKREGITRVRFGGHSLGGSLSLLLLLMFHLRSPLQRGFAGDLNPTAHTFGSFPVVASLPPFHLPWEGSQEGTDPSCPHSALHRLLDSLRSRLPEGGPGGAPPYSCNILSKLGLQSSAARGFVLDSDIIPRAFLALKHDAVRGVLGLRERLLGLGREGKRPLDADPCLFRPLGLVHFMQPEGAQVDVASLQPSLAEKVLHLDLGDFVRNPSLVAKSIQDHYFNHYVTNLESALAAASSPRADHRL